MGALRLLMLTVVAGGLGACADKPNPLKTRWDAYYAVSEAPPAHVVVVPPEGTTVPMAKLIARYVVNHLEKNNISAEVGGGTPSDGTHFILTGVAEDNVTDPRVRYRRVLHWLLSDAGGRVIATHAQGVEGTEQEWNFGSARLLEAIGINAAGPVAQMVLVESKTALPLDPLRRGLLVEAVTGVSAEDAQLLMDAVKTALRGTDLLVTGDPRQASFRLSGQVDTAPGAEPGALNVRITWVVATLERKELGRAVQENQVSAAQIQGGWGALAPRVGAAAAVGVEHIFGTRSGPLPGAPNRAEGDPPMVFLPGEPGRAPPPPQ